MASGELPFSGDEAEETRLKHSLAHRPQNEDEAAFSFWQFGSWSLRWGLKAITVHLNGGLKLEMDEIEIELVGKVVCHLADHFAARMLKSIVSHSSGLVQQHSAKPWLFLQHIIISHVGRRNKGISFYYSQFLPTIKPSL